MAHPAEFIKQGYKVKKIKARWIENAVPAQIQTKAETQVKTRSKNKKEGKKTMPKKKEEKKELTKEDLLGKKEEKAEEYNCSKCGAVVKEGQPNCPNCGAALDWAKIGK